MSTGVSANNWAILLGLELLVAGDIVGTVAAWPSLTSVAVLAAIVLIRIFLSVSLEVETTGRWPSMAAPNRARTQHAGERGQRHARSTRYAQPPSL